MGSATEDDRGGIKSGDKQRPILGERHIALADWTLLVANEAKLDELGSTGSAGDEHLASKLMARIGLDDREKWTSLGTAVRPSGPKALICGDEPR